MRAFADWIRACHRPGPQPRDDRQFLPEYVSILAGGAWRGTALAYYPPHGRARSEKGIPGRAPAGGAVARSAPTARAPHPTPARRGGAPQAATGPVRTRGAPGGHAP